MLLGTLSAEWTAALALGLEILHEKNIIHRDLKDQNVLLTKDLHVRLCDFGALNSQESDVEFM